MEILVGLFAIIVALAYGIWALVSPFVVMNLIERVGKLEGELKLRKRQELQQSRHRPATSAAPPDPTSRPTVSEPRSESPGTPSPAVASPTVAATTKPISESPKSPVTPTRPVFAPQVYREVSQQPVDRPAEPRPTDPRPSVPQPVTPPSPPSIATTPPKLPVPVVTPARESAPAAVPAIATPARIPAAVTAAANTGTPVIAAAPAAAANTKSQTAAKDDEPTTIEEILAGKWLTWVGALAVIIGAGFGFKYAIENNYIGPSERVVIGLLTGLACFAGGVYAMRRDYRFLAQGLTGAALGILYLSLYAAFGWYGILTYEAAFAGMIVTTTLGLSFAGYYNVQPTAVLGMLGGFLTPAMLWPDQDPMWTLFPYLLMLDVGVLLVAGVRRWAGLEILAFCGTLIIWFNWHQQFYHGENLGVTVGFMTAFMALFAFLSVWHNVIRRRKALAADFFLILVTPTAYFATLYALTFERLPQWQGEFSLLMMLFYAAMAVLAALWHPAGKSVIAALAGVSATFLILAAPLELTGHWVTICWICQAVLLIELGLYFREKALLWTGLSLLAKIQVILVIYFFGTLLDPIHFQTAFVRIQLHLIGRPELPLDNAQSWWALINGRSMSYLADVIAFAVLSWEFARRRKNAELLDDFLPKDPCWEVWLNVTAPIVALAMICLETYVWGTIWKWEATTVISAWTIWTAIFACGSIFWSRHFRARGLEGLGWILCALLACFMFITTVQTLDVNRAVLAAPDHVQAVWLLNPRGFGLLTVVLAGALISVIYHVFPVSKIDTGLANKIAAGEKLSRWFGRIAYIVALGMVLLETRVWGINHLWLKTELLTAYVAWTTSFMLGAIVWRVILRTVWVGGLIYGTLALTEIFLFTLASITIEYLSNPELAPLTIGRWWLLNPRGISFMIATLGCLLGAQLCFRLPRVLGQNRPLDMNLPDVLAVTAFLNGLAMVWLETLAWGIVSGWDQSMLVSVWTIWTVPFAVGAIYWGARKKSLGLEALGFLLWVVLGGLVAFNSFAAFNIRLIDFHSGIPLVHLNTMWLLNPRGISFLTVILGATIVAYIYRVVSQRSGTGGLTASDLSAISLSRMFASGAYLLGLELVLLETVVWGRDHQWLHESQFSACNSWTSLFLLGVVIWRLVRTAEWVENLVKLTFGILFLGLIPNIIQSWMSLSINFNQLAATQYDWWLFNARGAGILAAVISCGLAGVLYRQRLPGKQSPADTDMAGFFGLSSYFLALIMVLTETAVWGHSHGWLAGTILSSNVMWQSVFLVGLVIWSARRRTMDYDPLVAFVFLWLPVMLLILGSCSVDSVLNPEIGDRQPFQLALDRWCWNPRFMAFLVATLATSVSAGLYRGQFHNVKMKGVFTERDARNVNLSLMFAMFSYLSGVAMFTLEVFVQGTSRDWQTATSLGITLVWTAYATLTLIAGIYWKSGWLRAFSLILFVITVGKVFLVDVWHLDTVIRVFAFMSLGVCLLLVSFLYRRYRERIRSWIRPTSPVIDVENGDQRSEGEHPV